MKPTARGVAVAPRISTRAALSSSRRRSSVMPKTARRITSSVIACMLGWSGKGEPTGQDAIARSVASAITCS